VYLWWGRGPMITAGGLCILCCSSVLLHAFLQIVATSKEVLSIKQQLIHGIAFQKKN
jgi:hypothetical protein